MHNIKEYQDSIKNLADKVKRKKEDLNNAHKEIERKLINMYHCIEEIQFDHVSKSHFYMKKLQEILRERRIIKESSHQIQASLEHLQRSASAVVTAEKSSKKRLDSYKEKSMIGIETLNEEYKNR